MKVICAPDSFKETLSARQAADAMASGVRAGVEGVDVDMCPVADGGEGTLDVLADPLALDVRESRVTGPLGRPVVAQWGYNDSLRMAVIEMASASGLTLVPINERNPLHTTTHGTGELIQCAIDEGARDIIVGVGGSATVDGGAGAAQALGATFRDDGGRTLVQPLTGGMLMQVRHVEPPTMDGNVRLRIACDVTNPLVGPRGAAHTFAPQKGATGDLIDMLEQGLAHLAAVSGGRAENRGAGAAGGLAFGLATLCGAVLESGIELVLDALEFDRRCTNAHLVITGEGRLDEQTADGKAIAGLLSRAQRHSVPVVAVVGQNQGAGPVGLHDIVSLVHEFGVDQAVSEAAICIRAIVSRHIDQWLSGVIDRS